MIKKYLIHLNENKHSSFGESRQQTVKIKEDLIDIYNNSLAGALKSFNSNSIKAAKKQFLSQKVDLFKDDEQ